MDDLSQKDQVSGLDELKNLFQHVATPEEIKEKYEKARLKINAEIQQNPFPALGIALATGFVLGMWLKR